MEATTKIQKIKCLCINKITFAIPIIVVFSVYLQVAFVYFNTTDFIHTDPKNLPYHQWAVVNFIMWIYFLPIYLTLILVISILTKIKAILWILLYILLYIILFIFDPFGIINWLLD
jgi:hypothetical protein